MVELDVAALAVGRDLADGCGLGSYLSQVSGISRRRAAGFEPLVDLSGV
jgi:hypothetical protein